MVWRKTFKILHTIAALGYAGGIAAYLVALMSAPEITELSQHLVLRNNIAMISNWLIIPSMLIVVVSGLMSMVVHHPFMNAPWVWLKALSGLLIFEASLASIDAPADGSKRAVEKAINGEIDMQTLEGLVRDEWGALYILLGIAVVNVILGVWRPKFGLKTN
ncbi:MAG: hypothetical protein AAFN07_12410 [Pseudomonadota bacterium]